MKNKVELKKAIISSLVVIVFGTIIFGILQQIEYRVYIQGWNQKIGSIITKVKEEYPAVDENDVMEIVNGVEKVDDLFLRKYGIDLNRDAIVVESNQYFIPFLAWNLALLVGLLFVIMAIFLNYNHSKDRKLKEITQYIEQINHKNYQLDMNDNTEDELSILKSEIYKTTLMLKEVAETSQKDKLNLKDSLSDISHQLKTPLTSMSILLDNILENPDMDSETRLEFIKDVKREMVNIHFLVNALLKLSKLDANSVNFIKKEVSIEGLLEEAFQNVAVLCDLKNIEIERKGNPKLKLFCDRKWQTEAITNLLKNAIEHSNENSPIKVSWEENKLYTKLEIQDAGCGIEEQDLPHIFERFYKGKNSSQESIGIGLALTKAIIESDNGYIGVESEIGKGSKFIIKYFKS